MIDTRPERVDRTGPRTWLMAAVAGLSTFDPTLVLAVGPVIAALVYLSGRPLRLRMSATVNLSLIFVLWALLSWSWALHANIALYSAFRWACLLFILVAMLDFIRTVKQLRAVAVGYLLGAFFAVGRTIAENPGMLTGTTDERVGVVGDLNVNYLAYAFSAGFALVAVLWMTKARTLRIRVGLVATVIALAAGIYVTGTRAALLSLALLLAWMLVCRVARRPPLRLLVLAFAVAAFCLASGLTDRLSLSFESGARATGDWSGRLRLWPDARELWAAHPVVGIGGGGFAAERGRGIGAHNAILETGVGLGIVGVVLLIAVFWSTLRPAAKHHAFLVGALLVTSAPAYLTGVWETAPAAWVALAIVGRMTVVPATRPDDALLTTAPKPSTRPTPAGRTSSRTRSTATRTASPPTTG